ncbi:MAG: agmatine deiminase family protein [Muribaculaceae bacterium]
MAMPAEWEQQDAILMAWPHSNTDWQYMLNEVWQCYKQIAEAITSDEHLIIVTPCPLEVTQQLQSLPNFSNIHIINIDTNDTWARDFGPLSVNIDGNISFIDFKFNGWGLKFASNKDNMITRQLHSAGILTRPVINQLGFVLEGGSIESDGNGTIMTTSNCLLSPNRNEHMSRQLIEEHIKQCFGAKQVLWVDHGDLMGDDTDSHIDTLARFIPGNTIALTVCSDENDPHYEQLKLMQKQINTFCNAQGQPYNTMILPLPSPIYDEDGMRLPATYANFLITNNLVLVPTYNQPANDQAALKALQQAMPTHKVIGIDCRALIKQHGSLHCVTMQLFKNTTNISEI